MSRSDGSTRNRFAEHPGDKRALATRVLLGLGLAAGLAAACARSGSGAPPVVAPSSPAPAPIASTDAGDAGSPEPASVAGTGAPDAGGDAAAAAAAVERFQVPIGTSPARGPATALVTIVEFSDYQCPFCARVEPTLRDLRARYGDALRIVYKNAPLHFHPQAEPAAQAALEVRAEKGDAAFWAVHDALFQHQSELSTDSIVRFAKEAGAQPDKVRAAMTKHTYAADIESDQEIADDFDANGTPYFFVNGRPLVGAQPLEAFVTLIDEEMTSSRSLLATGVLPTAIYSAAIKSGTTAPEPDVKNARALPAGDPVRGPANAKVTIHEFADFQCPFCIRAEPTLRELRTNYGDRVRFVWHDLPLPFHQNAMPAALAAREARKQGGDRVFWQLHDRLLVEGAGLTRADLDGQARALGLNMAQWATALDSGAHQDEIESDHAAAESLDMVGTPAFLVVPNGSPSGYVIVGAQPYAKFRKLVERALGEAR